ncbi:MFS general substrate transporter [Marasmius fiardii PR-910]|nr:MFS general substrate transporter [Marasmius fiardii PR-910]
MRKTEILNYVVVDVPEYQKDHVDTESGSGKEGSKVSVEDVDERKTIRYIDFRILPILSLAYSFSLIDRTNLGAAMVAGLADDLKLQVGNRYSIITVLYFVPYVLLEVPSNAVLRKIGVRYVMTFLVIAWGAVQLAMGFVKDWRLLAFCRVLIGVFEAGFNPAMVFLISTWYKRHEVQKRLAVIYVVAGLMSGFSPILAYALSLLNGIHNIAGWSWIFVRVCMSSFVAFITTEFAGQIVEGAITLGLGILVYFLVPGFPDQNTFLDKAQTAFVLQRVEDDRGDSIPDEITFWKVLHHLSDWTIWIYGIMTACSTVPAYMLTFFLPTILKGMNFSTAQSLLLSSPQYGFACLSVLFFAWISDKTKHRATYIIFQALMTVIGCAMTAFVKSMAGRFAGTFLIAAGAVGCIVAILAWGANNVLSHSKRSVQSAVTIAGNGVGGIIASTVFRQQDSPKYIPGLWVTIGAQILCIGLAVMMSVRFHRMNKSKDGQLVGQIEGRAGFLYTT